MPFSFSILYLTFFGNTFRLWLQWGGGGGSVRSELQHCTVSDWEGRVNCNVFGCLVKVVIPGAELTVRQGVVGRGRGGAWGGGGGSIQYPLWGGGGGGVLLTGREVMEQARKA